MILLVLSELDARCAFAASIIGVFACLHTGFALRRRPSNAVIPTVDPLVAHVRGESVGILYVVCVLLFVVDAYATIVLTMSTCIGSIQWFYSLAAIGSMTLCTMYVIEEKSPGVYFATMVFVSSVIQVCAGVFALSWHSQCDAGTKDMALRCLVVSMIEGLFMSGWYLLAWLVFGC